MIQNGWNQEENEREGRILRDFKLGRLANVQDLEVCKVRIEVLEGEREALFKAFEAELGRLPRIIRWWYGI